MLISSGLGGGVWYYIGRGDRLQLKYLSEQELNFKWKILRKVSLPHSTAYCNMFLVYKNIYKKLHIRLKKYT